MLSHSSEFVKNFFRVLSNSFEVFRCAPGCSPFITQLFYDTTINSLCQELFLILFKFFLDSGIIYAALTDSLDIIPFRSRFVKHFLQFSSLFFGGFI